MRQIEMISHCKFESWYRGDYHVIRGGTYRTKDTKCWAFYREKKKSVETFSVLGLD